jgi:hypothetical protein
LFFQQLEGGRSTATTGFREAADEATMPHDGRQAVALPERSIDHSGNDIGETTSAPRDDSDVGLRVGVSAGSFLDSLFFDLTTLGSAPAPSPQRADRGRPDPFEASAIEAQKEQQHREQEQADSESRQKQRPL